MCGGSVASAKAYFITPYPKVRFAAVKSAGKSTSYQALDEHHQLLEQLHFDSLRIAIGRDEV